MAANVPIVINTAPEQEPAVHPVFERELLRALIDNLHKQNSIISELRDVLRDLRDELALQRDQRGRP